jgi:hypothetical protein
MYPIVYARCDAGKGDSFQSKIAFIKKADPRAIVLIANSEANGEVEFEVPSTAGFQSIGSGSIKIGKKNVWYNLLKGASSTSFGSMMSFI